jgi:hypothetical protein
MQLYPAITWSLVTVVIPPKDLEKKIHSVYYKALPLMGISFNIKKEWCTLPAMYQGLGLPSFPLLALSWKISFLQSNWGAVGSAQSNSLSMAYDNFMIKVCLYGNPMTWDFTKYGKLATPLTWFSNLWRLCHRFLAMVVINKEGQTFTPIRKNDMSIMSKFYRIGFRVGQLESLNTVRKYKNLIHLSDTVLCDSQTIDPAILTNKLLQSTQHCFSHEEPTQADLALWKEAITALCKGKGGIPSRLGKFLCRPHLEQSWYTNMDSSFLYCKDGTSYQVFHQNGGRSTLFRTRFEFIHMLNEGCKLHASCKH